MGRAVPHLPPAAGGLSVSARTGIEWCDHTFNIAWGCMKVSPGCAHCYADTLSHRHGFDVWGPKETTARRTFGTKHWHDPVLWNRAAEKAGVRARVFCSSMCDVFEDHPVIDLERERLWPLIRATPWLDWLLLTKRPERIVALLPADWGEGYPNVWLGTSVESQEYADPRIAPLVAVPAVVRFLSAEPLLGPLSLDRVLPIDGCAGAPHPGCATCAYPIHWVIVGGESGPGARPMQQEWARTLRDECAAAGVAFFLKQLGGHPNKRGHELALLDGRRHAEWPLTGVPA